MHIMSAAAQAKDWQRLAAEGLAGLSPTNLPSAELLYLDGLAVYLMGPEAPESPFTIEHGSVVVGHLLRSLVDSSNLELDDEPQSSPAMAEAREAIVEGRTCLRFAAFLA